MLVRSPLSPAATCLFAAGILAFAHWGAYNVGAHGPGHHVDIGPWTQKLVAPKDDSIPRPVEVFVSQAAITPTANEDNRRNGAGPLFGTLTLAAALPIALDAIGHFT